MDVGSAPSTRSSKARNSQRPGIFHRQSTAAAVLRSAQISQSIAPSAFAPGWRSAAVVIALAGFVFGLVFRRDVSGAVRV